MANIMIDIAAEFVGNKAFKKADTATGKLTKNVKSLAKTLGVAFSATAVIAFGKASLKAFAEDEKAATRLTKAVENLGLGFEDSRIKNFISDLEKTAGVADDVLRPAFQSLLQTTGSVAKSQELLKLALDVSAGSGVDAVQVSKDLSLAYLGQTKGLAKYNLGLTKAELNTAGFVTIQNKLNEQYSGQNAARLETYAGKMETLGVAAGNAQEIIGKGLVDALSMLGENDSVSNLADDMESVALYIGDAIRGVGVLVEYLKSIPGAGILFDAFKLGFKSTPLGLLNELGKVNRTAPKPFTTGMSVSGATDTGNKADAARKAAEAAAAKRATELLALQKKTLKSQQDNLKINKAKAIFDLQKIQIEAALKGKISAEDRIRLLLMKAIAEENVDMIDKYTKALADAQAKALELQGTLDKIKATTFPDPFAGWKSSAGNTTAAINEMVGAMFAVQTQIQANGREWSSFANQVVNTQIQSNGREWSSQFSPSATNPLASIMTSTVPMTTQQLQVVVNGSIIAEEDLKKAIVDAVNQSGLTGNQLITGTLDRMVAI